MSKENFIIFGSPLIGQEEIDEVVASLQSCWLGTGPKVARFEEDFKKYKQAKYAAAVNSCTAALHLSLLSLNLQSGDEVITTPMTFCATINSIIHSGAIPVLVDCERDSLNIDPQLIETKITPRTKAILLVHFAGRPCNMDKIMAIARQHNLRIIEDCAHAIETTYHGQPAGTFGDFGCFSFYVTKNVITGEGGMVLANREEDIARIKVLALHGMSRDAWKRFSDEGYKHYYVTEAGFKYNMMDLQAAIGIHQLARVEGNWLMREKIWHQYTESFRDLSIGLPLTPETNTKHGYHLYTILIDKAKTGISRDEFLNAMQGEGIGVGVHYLSIPEHPYYQRTFHWNPDDFPCARDIGRQTVSIPLSAKLTSNDVERIINAVKKFIKPKSCITETFIYV